MQRATEAQDDTTFNVMLDTEMIHCEGTMTATITTHNFPTVTPAKVTGRF